MQQDVIIIGAGHAGVQAAASLREEGFEGRVTLVSDEPDLPYHKPPLSKTFIKQADAEPQILRAGAFYTANAIELALGQRVERLDLAAQRIVFDTGTSMRFDRLVLATGSRPRLLALDGGPFANLYSLRNLADARTIRAAATDADDVLILGGGFIGLEIAATLSAAGRRVTVIEAQQRLLARVVAEPVSVHVRARLESLGVRVAVAVTLAGVESSAGRITAAVTSTGERVPVAIVVVGVGAIPNIELAAVAGLTVGNGIHVDASLRTNVPEVLAIGDVASFRHWQTATDLRLESVQNATDHARLAARTLTGHADAFDRVPWFWSDIGDMKLQMVGLTLGSDRHVVSGDPGENRFSIYHFAGDRLLAIESVNRPADHMLGRRMIGDGFSPDPAQVRAGAAALKSAFEAWRAGQPGPRGSSTGF